VLHLGRGMAAAGVVRVVNLLLRGSSLLLARWRDMSWGTCAVHVPLHTRQLRQLRWGGVAVERVAALPTPLHACQLGLPGKVGLPLGGVPHSVSC
jgi:hypothetical protein